MAALRIVCAAAALLGGASGETDRTYVMDDGSDTGIKVTYTKAPGDEFQYIPRSDGKNEILALEEEARWLGGMARYRRQPAITRTLLRCDVCELLKPEMIAALDALNDRWGEALGTEHIDEHFYHDQDNWCMDMTEVHSLLLDKDGSDGGQAIPKYGRSVGRDTVRGGWPEAFFFMTCEDMLHALTSEELLNIARARADKDLKWSDNAKIELCAARYRCDVTTDSLRRIWAEKLKASGFSPDFELGAPPAHRDSEWEQDVEGRLKALQQGEEVNPLPAEPVQVDKAKQAGMPEVPKIPGARQYVARGHGVKMHSTQRPQTQAQTDDLIKRLTKALEKGEDSLFEFEQLDKAADRLLESRRKAKADLLKRRKKRAEEREASRKRSDDGEL